MYRASVVICASQNVQLFRSIIKKQLVMMAFSLSVSLLLMDMANVSNESVSIYRW